MSRGGAPRGLLLHLSLACSLAHHPTCLMPVIMGLAGADGVTKLSCLSACLIDWCAGLTDRPGLNCRLTRKASHMAPFGLHNHLPNSKT